MSRVNFAILTEEERDTRLNNMCKLVKRMRKQLKDINLKMKNNAPKLLNKYINDYSKEIRKAKESTKVNNETNNHTTNSLSEAEASTEIDFKKICSAFEKLNQNHQQFEYDDERLIFQNLINLVSEGKLSSDSLHFKRINNIIRGLMSESNNKTEENIPMNLASPAGNEKETKIPQELIKSIYCIDQPIQYIPVEKNENPKPIQPVAVNNTINSCSFNFKENSSILSNIIFSNQPEIENHLLDLLLQERYKRFLYLSNNNKVQINCRFSGNYSMNIALDNNV